MTSLEKLLNIYQGIDFSENAVYLKGNKYKFIRQSTSYIMLDVGIDFDEGFLSREFINKNIAVLQKVIPYIYNDRYFVSIVPKNKMKLEIKVYFGKTVIINETLFFYNVYKFLGIPIFNRWIKGYYEEKYKNVPWERKKPSKLSVFFSKIKKVFRKRKKNIKQ